ncbi:MAG: DUF998 domain-containing protein [Nitrososphaerales archaeon]
MIKAKIFWVVSGLIILYVILDVIAQLLPPHYSPISQAESDLAVGPYGSIMTVNFLNRGILSIAFVYALYKTFEKETRRQYRTGLLSLGAWGIASLLLAVFPADVAPSQQTIHEAIHLILAFLAFFGGAFGVLLLSINFAQNEKLRSFKTVTLTISALALIFFLILFGMPFIAPHIVSRIEGLTERVFIGLVLVWILLVSLLLAKE